jgi:cytochrome c551/c552
VRRLVPFAVLALLLVGCSDTVPGGKKVVTPTPDTIVGKVPKPAPALVGNAADGKAVFVSAGCGACHIFTPAAQTTGKVGPDLDKLAEFAKTANQALEAFTSSSITDPGGYVAPGYSAGIMPATYTTSLKKQQLADLVAFLVKGP